MKLETLATRRSFIKTAGVGTLSALTISRIGAASRLIAENSTSEKSIRIGIIGAENSHTIGFGKLFNIDKLFPGVEVNYVWGETEELAKAAMSQGQIPTIVKDPLEMLGNIDALIVDHRHPKYHLQAAEPFVRAGIPTFIDKPFCYRVAEGKEFLEMARRVGTPITSYSSIAHSDGTFDIKKQVETMGAISHVTVSGPADLESPYGGIFFYGIHIVQPLMYIFGDDIRRVRISRSGKNATATLIFGNDMLATLVFKNLSYGWRTFVETKEGTVELKSRIEDSVPGKNYTDMVEMFRTGKEPLAHESILKSIAVLEALERSAADEKWVNVKMQG
jgi:predicted dehydrogenase